MVQTDSHRFNSHVKRLSLSASVVIIFITRLLATSRIITQYFNHSLLYSFTTSPLKIDEPLSTFQFEKITYGDNSNKRYRNILRHELELKWIKLLQTPYLLGFNDNIYHEGNISR